MIYQKSISHLCDSFLSVTLIFSYWWKSNRNPLAGKDTESFTEQSWGRVAPLWLVQLLSIPFWAPVLHLSACHTWVIRHCWDITKYHFPARQCSMQDSTWPAGLLEYSEETFSKNNVLGISFVCVSRIGSQDHPTAGNEKGIIITGWN